MKKQFVILIKLNKDIVKYVLDGLLYFPSWHGNIWDYEERSSMLLLKVACTAK